MKELRVKLTPTDLIQTSQELKAEGLVQGKDFDFAYHQSKWDDMIGEIPTYTIFTFYEDSWATWFAIKYL
jgi:hypothetical protein